MPGTKEGARKMTKTFKQKYGEDYYKKMSKIGGAVMDKTKGLKGFALRDKKELQKMAKNARYQKFRKEFIEKCPGMLIPSLAEWGNDTERFNEMLRKREVR